MNMNTKLILWVVGGAIALPLSLAALIVAVHYVVYFGAWLVGSPVGGFVAVAAMFMMVLGAILGAVFEAVHSSRK